MHLKRTISCFNCGREVEYIECSEWGVPSDNPKCSALKGWFTLIIWKGFRELEEKHFCSLPCLRRWVKAAFLEIPPIFRKAFEEEEP